MTCINGRFSAADQPSCSLGEFVVKNNNEEYLVINSPTEVKTCGGINICTEITNGKQTLNLSGAGELSISPGNSVQLPDNSATNEIQTLSLNGGTVSLTNGGSFVLPDADATNELQTLSISNKALQLSKGNSVPLPFVKMVSSNGASLTTSSTGYQTLIQSAVTLPANGSVKIEFQCSVWCDLRPAGYQYCDYRFFVSDSATQLSADFDQSFVEVYMSSTAQDVVSLSWVVQRSAGPTTFYALGQKVDSSGTVVMPQGGIIKPRLIVTFFPE